MHCPESGQRESSSASSSETRLPGRRAGSASPSQQAPSASKQNHPEGGSAGMSKRRLDVTPTQAVASMLATLTGAIAAASLGIAGTIIGAAVMSLASTVGAAIYKHYLARGHEGLRAAA